MNKLLVRLAFLTTKQVGFIALVVGFIYWNTVFDDGSSLDPQISNLQAQLQQEQRKKTETEEALKKRDHLQETLASLTAKYENLSRLVPIELNSSDLNRQLDQLARTSRISQLSRRPKPIVSGKVLDEWPVEMQFTGSYGDIAQFVYQTSVTEKVMLVKKLKITSPKDYDGRLNFDVIVAAVKLSAARATNSNPLSPAGAVK